MKKVVLQLIKIYQYTISLDHGLLSYFTSGPRCRFVPTCSQYTYDAVKTYGVIRGLWMGVKRVSRCHPWNEGGFDKVSKNSK